MIVSSGSVAKFSMVHPIIVQGLFRLTLPNCILKICEDVWRPSRLESECILGEAMEFLFPHQECNPFNSKASGRLCCAKKVPNDLSHCHTKRRMGVRGRTHPSFGVTPTFQKKKKKTSDFFNPIK